MYTAGRLEGSLVGSVPPEGGPGLVSLAFKSLLDPSSFDALGFSLEVESS
mgnify:CR=1 FL=1